MQTLELCDGTNKKSEKIKITEKNESGILSKLFGGTDEHLKSTVLPCTDLLVEIKAQGTYLLYSALTKFFTVKIYFFNFLDKFNFFLCYGMKAFLFHCAKFLHFIGYVNAQVYLSIYLFISSIYLFVYLFIYLFINLYIYLFINLYIYLFTYLFISSIYLLLCSILFFHYLFVNFIYLIIVVNSSHCYAFLFHSILSDYIFHISNEFQFSIF